MKAFHQRQTRKSLDEAHSSATSKGMTFDRRTFVECSERMKRLVPTLSRSKAIKNDTNNIPSYKAESGSTFGNRIAINGTGSGSIGSVNSSIAKELEESDSDDNDEGNFVEISNNDFPIDVDVPNTRSRSASTSVFESKRNSNYMQEEGESTIDNNGVQVIYIRSGGEIQLQANLTLPANFQKSPSSVSSRRRMWLKPFSRIASMMSSIGSNIDITTYPTP